MLKSNRALIAAAAGALMLSFGSSAFSKDSVFPYSPNETGEYVPAGVADMPASSGRTSSGSTIREVGSTQQQYGAANTFPFSPNETGEYAAPARNA